MPEEAIEAVRLLYANPSDQVFSFVPPVFATHAENFYSQLGSPAICRDNVWTYYLEILEGFHQLAIAHALMSELTEAGARQIRLLTESDTGSGRGDSWGYDIELLGEVHEEIGDVEDDYCSDHDGSDNSDPEVSFSEDEM